MRQELGESYKLPFQRYVQEPRMRLHAPPSCKRFQACLCLVGDSPLLSADSIKQLHQEHPNKPLNALFLPHTLRRFFLTLESFGTRPATSRRVSRSATVLNRKGDSRATHLHFLFDTAHLFETLNRVPRHPTTEERYLTDVIGLTLNDEKKVTALSIETGKNWLDSTRQRTCNGLRATSLT